MLVITCRPGDVVVIRDQAGKVIGSVKLKKIIPSRARLAFSFPRGIAINRDVVDQEIYGEVET